jgi:hypothetical protein
MKKYIFALLIATALFSCNTNEKAVLKNRVDSLTVQLNASREAEQSLNEVGILIDSIDASRESLKIKMIEGSSYADYVNRLKDINTYVKQTEAKLDALEKENKNSSKISRGSIRRLKADLEKRTKEILDLQLQIANLRDENMALWTKNNQKDSILSMRDQVIKLREGDITSLEKLVNDTNEENKMVVANLYYAQAQALEKVANRTQFAPRKKKEARQEALELYKLSLSLGKTEALSKITDLEKELS